jgi:hypothetical protein
MQDLVKHLEADATRTMRERLAWYLNTTGLTAKNVASAIHVSHEGPVQRYLAGEDVDGMDGAVARLFNIEPGDEQWEALPFDNTISVWELCRLAAKRHRMVAVEGRSGYGKTSALRLYARLFGAIHFEYDEVSGCRDALRKMCKLVGVPYITSRVYSIAQLRDFLLTRLKQIGKPLIVDQFDTAPFRLIEAVRGIWDEARIPVIIAGLDGRLMERLQRRNSRENCEQILSRISGHIVLPPPSERDADLLCQRFGIRSVRAREFLLPRGAVGGYRVMRTLCEDAGELAEANGLRAITYECLTTASKYVYLAADPSLDEAASIANQPNRGIER